MKAPTTVSVIEQNSQVSKSLFRYLKKAGAFRAGSVYPSMEQALKRAPQHPPAVLLIDLSLPQRSMLEGLRWLKANLKETRIAVLSGGHGLDCIFQTFKTGADAWFLKEETSAQLVENIQEFLRGGSPISAAAARLLVSSYQAEGGQARGSRRLSSRELEIMKQLSRGLADKEIASHLSIALTTVNDHLKSVYRKLHVHSRTEAVAKYLESVHADPLIGDASQ